MNKNFRIDLVDSEKESAMLNNFSQNPTVIKVIGVGNGGCNAVNRMIDVGLNGVEFIAMNTDSQSLSRSNADKKIILGANLTKGLGAGTNPERGAEAAKENAEEITEIVKGADLVFVASTFGGGTGTGASPVIADIAKRSGALTIGVVTKPFEMEGKFKMKQAVAGIERMSTAVDSLIIIPNENLYKMSENVVSLEEGFSIIDDILRQGVQGISDIITQNGFGVNVDFADVRTMISISDGRAHLGIGIGKGETRLEKAIKNAFDNPLLDVASIKNSKGILANIVHPKDFSMLEYRKATEIIHTYANEDANIKIGTCANEELKDEIRITIVATGFEANRVGSDNNTSSSSVKEVKVEESRNSEEDEDDHYEADLLQRRIEAIRNKARINTITANVSNTTEKENLKTVAKENIEIEEAHTIEETKNNSERDNEKENLLSAIKTELVKEDTEMSRKTSINNMPFEIASENEMIEHALRGNKYDIYDNDKEVDYDTPAFLRRGIQTKRSK